MVVHDAVIVGAGLMGSIISKNLKEKGFNVLTIDSKEKFAGSKPAACLMKPSWYCGLDRHISRSSLNLLDRLYGISDIKFQFGPSKVLVHWVNPALILQPEDLTGKVQHIVNKNDNWCLKVLPPGQPSQYIWTKIVIVAAGVWTNELVKMEENISWQTGIAYLLPEEKIEQPFIKPWAPYKQLVAFNRGDGLWISDGSTLLKKSLTEEKTEKIYNRCSKEFPENVKKYHELSGYRPYVKTKPCYLKETAPGLIVATGGAKNGTILAGWCAHEIARRLENDNVRL